MSLQLRGSHLTKTVHAATYPAISPTRSELSQAGKTVLVTGSSEGIGYGIARAFVQASAAKVILLARTTANLDSAVASLKNEVPDAVSEIVGVTCDIADPASAATFWDSQGKAGVVVDVLCLNAATPSEFQTVLDRGTDKIWGDLNMNLRAQVYFTERFYKQNGKGAGGPKYLVNTSSVAIYEHNAPVSPGYALSKLAGAAAIQRIALDVKPEDMQVISFHPGAVLTRAAEEAAKARAVPKDDQAEPTTTAGHTIVRIPADVPGQFSVWAASPEAKFLHGRFVWAQWDVEELKSGELRRRIDEDNFFLRVGVVGL